MSATPPRRFKAEPIETTVKPSKDVSPRQENDSKPVRRFAVEPVETSPKVHRKFDPQPVETTVMSSRDANKQPPPREFKPEPVENTVKKARRNSRGKFDEEWASQTQDFEPRPCEPTSPKQLRFQEQPAMAKGKKPPRKFAPMLIETAKRSRKSGDSAHALLPSDKTEAVSGQDILSQRRNRLRPVPPPPINTPNGDFTKNPLFKEISQRATSPLSMRRPSSLSSMRSHHSFRVPDLDPIESSESERSSPPSPSTSPSATSDHSYMYTEATRMRESVDDSVSGYLLELAAKAAEKQLREQAMAAFPNDDHHEPVHHYIDRESDEGEDQTEESRHRRDSSFNEVNWDLVAMQKHREQLDKQKEAERERQKKKWEAEMKKPAPTSPGPWGNSAARFDPKNGAHGAPQDGELDRMRKGARPPMLGGDIKFPRCPSPEPARFDTTQGCDAVRMAMCYLSEQSEQAEKGEGLWCGQNDSCKSVNKTPSLYSASSRNPSPSRGGPGGLWGGCCAKSGQTPPRGPSGLLTPSKEIPNPMSPCPTPRTSLMPPTPPPSNVDFAGIDEKLANEAAIEEDFGDDFVTQVYNYLSLGYPSIAHMFDDELSKISSIPVTELRQDDHLAMSRGYIRLGGDGNLADAAITEETCMRWRALRVYVREWAKQQPTMVADSTVGGVGIAVRKGSWAI